MKRTILLWAVLLSPVFLVSGQTQQGQGNGFFRQEGIASWYGNEFAGRPTASGEVFDPSLLTAAHPTLPFGTLITVTNTQNNKQVMVRINDRGPFVSNRILDVSQAAAEQLDMIITGTAPVVLEASVSLSVISDPVQAAPVPQSAPIPQVAPIPQAAPIPQTASVPQAAAIPQVAPIPQEVPIPQTEYQSPDTYTGFSESLPLKAVLIPGIPPMGSGKQYRLQVGSYKIARYALDAFDKLKNLGLSPAYERHGEFYRVVLSGIRPEEVPSLAEQLGTAGFMEVLIREER